MATENDAETEVTTVSIDADPACSHPAEARRLLGFMGPTAIATCTDCGGVVATTMGAGDDADSDLPGGR